MKKLVLGLALVGVFALGNGPVRAKCVPGPYYATPAWDQQLPGSKRFICLADWDDQAVLDQETGLVWQRSPDSTVQTAQWEFAVFACHVLGSGHSGGPISVPTGNRLGWRLPSVEELASLVDPTENNPALPAGHPFQGIQNARYWTASTGEGIPEAAYMVGFGSRDDIQRIFLVLKTFNNFYWCVRGGASISNPPY